MYQKLPLLILLFIAVTWFGVAAYSQTSQDSLILSEKEATSSPLVQRILPARQEPSPTPHPHPRLLFLGDLMYDRNIRARTAEHGTRWPLAPLEPLMRSHDFVVANLEGPITTSASTSLGTVPGSPKNFIFTFPADTAEGLAQQGRFILALGNNHILNQGEAGVVSTKTALEKAQIPYFGWTSLEPKPNERVHIQEIHGVRFAFTNYNQFLSQGYEMAIADIKWAETQPGVAATILMPHWGNEYQPVANETIETWATEFITAGADLIIGGHPHVVQNFSEINGVPVYFSLGNAVFDQYFSPEVMKGLAVSVTFDPISKKWEFKEHPLAIEKTGQTRLIETDQRN